MQTIELLLLVIVMFLLFRIKFGPRFLAGNSNDWLVVEWHELDAGEVMWRGESPVHIEFVPIIGWEYDHWGHKYDKLSPITPPHYQVRSRLDNTAKYQTMSYWIRDGVVSDISYYWGHAGDFWENLSEHAFAGRTIKVHGNVPDCYRERVSDTIALAERQQIQSRE